MHDVLWLASFTLADAAATAEVKAALIGGLALVLGSSIPVLLSRREREPKAVRDLRATEIRLRRQIESERDAALTRAVTAEAEVDRLEKLCWRSGLDPSPPEPEASS